jgi:hypothetical protein
MLPSVSLHGSLGLKPINWLCSDSGSGSPKKSHRTTKSLRGEFGLQPVQGGERNVSTNRSWAARSALPGWPLIPHQHSAGGGVGGQYSRVISTRHCIPLLNRPAIPQALELDLLKILPMSPSRTENSDHLVGLKRLCNNIESSKVKGFRP